MAPRQLKWRNLILGGTFLGAVVAVALGVLLFARVGAVRGDSFILYAAFSDARLIIPNSEVWLLGEKVGIVEEITFRPPADDTTAHVLLRLKLWERARPYIRRDATAQLRSGGSLLGAPVVYINGGSRVAAAVTSGDTVVALARLDPDQLQTDIRGGLADARVVLADLRSVAAGVGRTRSTVSSLLGGAGDGRLSGPVGDLVRSMERLTGSETGSVGLLMADTQIRRRAAGISARFDSLVTATREPIGTVGRARSDSALARAVAALLAEATQVRGEANALMMALTRTTSDSAAAVVTDTGAVASPAMDRGTDSAATAGAIGVSGAARPVAPIATPASRAALEMRAELRQVDSAMAAVIADLKRRPWRYLPF